MSTAGAADARITAHAVEAGKQFRKIEFRGVRGFALGDEAGRLFEARLRGHGRGGLVVLTCAKERVPDLADWLIGRGAEQVTVGQLDYVFSAKSTLYERLARRLG